MSMISLTAMPAAVETRLGDSSFKTILLICCAGLAALLSPVLARPGGAGGRGDQWGEHYRGGFQPLTSGRGGRGLGGRRSRRWFGRRATPADRGRVG